MSEHAHPRTWTLRPYDAEGRRVRAEVDGPVIPASPTVLVELERMLDLLEILAATPKGDISREYARWKQAADNACDFLRAHGRLS